MNPFKSSHDLGPDHRMTQTYNLLQEPDTGHRGQFGLQPSCIILNLNVADFPYTLSDHTESIKYH